MRKPCITNGPLIAIHQGVIPPEMQGRVFATLVSISQAMAPLGMAIAGPTADKLGVHNWFLLSGAACIGRSRIDMSAILQIQLLGHFQFFYADAPVATIRSGRRQALLAYLLLHRDAPLARSRLAFLFWPDSTEAQALTNLRKHLHHLRRKLPDADCYLYLDARTVRWLPGAPFALDVADLEAAMTIADQARQEGNQVAEYGALEQIVTLYKGDLLPSCYDDWILPERERLQQACIRALERLTTLCEDQREIGTAIEYASRLLRQDPLHEESYRHLMRLYALVDDRANALQIYHTCETVLQRELGVTPSPATQELYERLMQATLAHRPLPTAPAPPSPLVGRHQEWAQLQSVWRAATRHAPQVVLVKGDSGIGKTRLVEEMVHWAHKQGIDATLARCYAAEDNLAFAPVVTWLRARPLPSLDTTWRRELARLLPETIAEADDIVPPYPMIEPGQRQLLFEALARAILGHRSPLLLALDDIQWCDHETLAWLQYVVRFDHRARLLVLATLNQTATQNDPEHLNLLLRALYHDRQLTEVVLGPLDRASTAQMGANLAGRELEPDLAADLYRETEGNPLFVAEMVHAGLVFEKARSGDASRPLPPRMQAAIEARLSQLSSAARDLAGLAAAVGRRFDFDVLAQASAEEQGTLVQALDELWQHRVIHERGQDGYDFAHDKLREVAYASLSAARRRLHHLRIAQALEALYAADLATLSTQLALHYDRADQPRQAIAYYCRAASMARGIFATQETLRCLERALALTEGLRPSREGQSERLDILLNLMRTCFADGRVTAAERRLREAIALGHDMTLPPRRLARMIYWLGEILHWQGRYDEQARAGERGLTLLGSDSRSIEAALMGELISVGQGAPNTIRLPDPSVDRPDGTILERRLWYAVFETQRKLELDTGGKK